jgi:hypothetical protein
MADTLFGILIENFLETSHSVFILCQTTHRLQKHGTRKPIKGNDIPDPRTRKRSPNTLVQKHQTSRVFKTHGLGFGARIDKGHVNRGMDLNGPECACQSVHPLELFLHRAGLGHVFCGQELVPAWTGGLSNVGESTSQRRSIKKITLLQ